MKQDELIIVDGDGGEALRITDDGGEVSLRTYDAFDFAIPTILDAGGVAALRDWLAAWIARREAVDVDDRQAALLLGDG